jgi:hypothetical protein
MTTIRFNTNANRYINDKGQFISETFVREKIDAFNAQNQNKVKELLTNFHNSETKDHDALLTNIAERIKNSTVVNYVVGRGGVKQVTPENIRSIESRLNAQFRLSFDENGRAWGLEEVISALENGEITPAMASYRIGQYMKASRHAFDAGVNDRDTSPYMLRVLHGSNNCAECISYAAAGAVPRGQLPLPGEACSCRANCNCSVTYLSESQFSKWQISNFSSAVE